MVVLRSAAKVWWTIEDLLQQHELHIAHRFDVVIDGHGKDDVSTGGHVVWTRERSGSYMPTPVIYRGHLYVLKNEGILACYDLASGEQKYETRIEKVGSGFSASPVSADAVISVLPLTLPFR